MTTATLPPGTPLTKEQFRERMAARLAAAKKPQKPHHPWAGQEDHKTNSDRAAGQKRRVIRSDGIVFESRRAAAEAAGHKSAGNICTLIKTGGKDRNGFTYKDA